MCVRGSGVSQLVEWLGYELDDPGSNSRQGAKKGLSVSSPSRPDRLFGLTQPPIQRVPGGSLPGGKADDEVKLSVQRWTDKQPQTFFEGGIMKWPEQCRQCTEVKGEYEEKQVHVQKSPVYIWTVLVRKGYQPR
jgi:hypothetical protein